MNNLEEWFDELEFKADNTSLTYPDQVILLDDCLQKLNLNKDNLNIVKLGELRQKLKKKYPDYQLLINDIIQVLKNKIINDTLEKSDEQLLVFQSIKYQKGYDNSPINKIIFKQAPPSTFFVSTCECENYDNPLFIKRRELFYN